MTTIDIDIDAIRPLVERYPIATNQYQMDLALRIAEASPALLAKVDELTAERDLASDLLDGTAKALGLDLDNYHVHHEVPAKVDELTTALANVPPAWATFTADDMHGAGLETVAAEMDRDALASELAKVVAQLTAANRRADGLQADLDSATKANTAWANQDARLRKAAMTFRSTMIGQHEWGGHLIEGDCPDCIKAADELDGSLACDRYREWQRQYEDALGTYLPSEVAR